MTSEADSIRMIKRELVLMKTFNYVICVFSVIKDSY